VFHKYVHLRSGWEWEVPKEPTEFRAGSIRDNITGAMTWFASGRLSAQGIARQVDPRDCDGVYRELREQSNDALTAIFDWTRLENEQ
jgi:hypothetical protein